ncbi:MAG: HAMP domain-containing histidine kinase, partial [Sulfurovum sp.]|nr:HAMP domain-containing histidine kinase [Sulfurovum sp.]
IINTSYKDDLGFNLGFAKDTFEKHKSQNIIGCSFPIHENISQKFFSFTDSYLSKNDDDQIAVLQVSYRYMEATQAFSQLKKLIKNYPSVKQAKAYSFVNDHCHDEIFLNGYDTSKPALQEMMFYRKEALVLSNKLSKNNLLEEDIIKDGVHYKLLSMSTTNPIDKDVKVLYTLLLDNSKFYDQLKNLNILITLISLMGIIGIFIMSKVRAKEIKLSDQDNFIQSAMHEIKTPLSIITLNNELRQLEQGTDTYSEEIDSALKVLHNSYRSMSFIMTKDQVGYEIETLDLSEIVKKRIEYFQTIAAVNDKKITFDIDSHCRIDISLIELSRLIDNSLYNAIKYSAVGSPIEVILANNVLSFHNLGKAIENKEKVFNKYFRENKTVGGYGLGLSIIKDIADKYHIDIELQSDTDKGTIFTYIFHYHTNDIV